jgi:hypothetical protein
MWQLLAYQEQYTHRLQHTRNKQGVLRDPAEVSGLVTEGSSDAHRLEGLEVHTTNKQQQQQQGHKHRFEIRV